MRIFAGDLGQLLPGERLPVTAVVDPASASSGSSGLSGGAIAGAASQLSIPSF